MEALGQAWDSEDSVVGHCAGPGLSHVCEHDDKGTAGEDIHIVVHIQVFNLGEVPHLKPLATAAVSSRGGGCQDQPL